MYNYTMRLGIVGHEAAKFTPVTETKARAAIRDLIRSHTNCTTVISGGCHLGGIDVWSVEEAKALGLATKEFLPHNRSWTTGYKIRNIQIAQYSDVVVCFVVDKLPPTFIGPRFEFCYHCGARDHIKSGGCWTAKYARSLGRTGTIVVITQV